MSELHISGRPGIVSNCTIFNLTETVRRAKFPMSIDPQNINNEITKGINGIFSAPIGSGHDNALCGIIVQFDLRFTNKAWVEMERYHFVDIISSQSTMHKITKFDFESDSTYSKYTDARMTEIMRELIARYNETQDPEDYLRVLYSNPAGFYLTAGITTNYRALKTIYAQRKNHRLPEWREFCKWIESLPYSEWLTGKEVVNE